MGLSFGTITFDSGDLEGHNEFIKLKKFFLEWTLKIWPRLNKSLSHTTQV